MRKMIFFCAALLFVCNSFANFESRSYVLYASQVLIPLGNKGKTISLLELSQIETNKLEALTGRKMDLLTKITFKAAQRKLVKKIHSDGTLEKRFAKKLEKGLRKPGDKKPFHAGGFFLGFFLGFIGVLIAYLIKDDDKNRRVTWSLIGVGAILAIGLIILLIVGPLN